MFEKVILLSGQISSGKSTLANGLAERFEMEILKTREVIGKLVPDDLSRNRKVLQNKGDSLDKKKHGKWVLDALRERMRSVRPSAVMIVDSIRTVDQIEAIREAYGRQVVHIHLKAPESELEKRYNLRHTQGTETTRNYAEAKENVTEQLIEELAEIADAVIDTKQCTQEDVLCRVASHLRVCRGSGKGFVDVVVGGQYGSEGKGQIVAYLANEYDILVRVGGPNAGHKVYEKPEPFTYHQLPSGTRRSEARLLLGPGATIRVDKLFKEIAECHVEVDRLSIDPNTMIISDEDVQVENEGENKIGSTQQGVGAAGARRISGRTKSSPPLLAKDIPALRPYLGSALEILDGAFSFGKRVLLEGTQGTALSLYHGYYPYVTSRDTTVSGCLSEAGIPPSRVRRVIMVCRTYPIRVKSPKGGSSGPMAQEISLEEIARRSGKNLAEIKTTEMTSTTYKQRRIGEFEWDLLRKAIALNGPTDIALTFTDYLSDKNGIAKRFEQLTPSTINFIQEIERVSRAPVSLIATGFNTRSVIDRRSW